MTYYYQSASERGDKNLTEGIRFQMVPTEARIFSKTLTLDNKKKLKKSSLV